MIGKGYTYDHALLLKDSYAVTGPAASTVSSAARILDLGAGRVDGRVIVNVTAIKVSDNDEIYRLQLQLSQSSSFASGIVVAATLELGALEIVGGSADTPAGEYELAFTNEYGGTNYRYARLYNATAGTSETITHTAFAVLQAAHG